MDEAAALKDGLRQRWDENLLSPFCMLPGLHGRTLHFRYGPQVIDPPLGFVGNFLGWGEEKGKIRGCIQTYSKYT